MGENSLGCKRGKVFSKSPSPEALREQSNVSFYNTAGACAPAGYLEFCRKSAGQIHAALNRRLIALTIRCDNAGINKIFQAVFAKVRAAEFV